MPKGHPEDLRSACEASLRRLRLERIDLYQLHTPDPSVPYAESIGALNALRSAGKIWHIGVSNVTPEQFAVARTTTDIATVQNRLNLANGDWHNMLIECESNEIGFIPYRPLRGWDGPTHEQVLTAPPPGTAQAPIRSPSHCPSPGQQPLHTSKTTSPRRRSNSNKTR